MKRSFDELTSALCAAEALLSEDGRSLNRESRDLLGQITVRTNGGHKDGVLLLSL